MRCSERQWLSSLPFTCPPGKTSSSGTQQAENQTNIGSITGKKKQAAELRAQHDGAQSRCDTREKKKQDSEAAASTSGKPRPCPWLTRWTTSCLTVLQEPSVPKHLSPSFISHCVQMCADSRAAKDYYTVTQNFNLTVSARCIAAKHICIYMI